VLLDESDPVWRALRHEDMGTVIDAVDDGVRAANARDARRRALDASDVGDLRELMSSLTSDDKLVDDKFALHYRMKQAIVEKFEARNFHEVLDIEQVRVGHRGDSHAARRVLRGGLRGAPQAAPPPPPPRAPRSSPAGATRLARILAPRRSRRRCARSCATTG